MVNIIGGCCGTTPEHIRAFAAIAGEYTPRKPLVPRPRCPPDGTIRRARGCNFVNVGERTNLSGSARFRRLIGEVNLRKRSKSPGNKWKTGANYRRKHGRWTDRWSCFHAALHEPRCGGARYFCVPVMVDSSDWDVIEAGFSVSREKASSTISLKEGEEAMERARQVPGMAQPLSSWHSMKRDRRRSESTSCHLSTGIPHTRGRVRFSPQDIIFDPNILTVATGMPGTIATRKS